MMRVFSFGGGLQSWTVLALQSMGKIKPFDAYVYADMGDSEPHTRDYIEQHIGKFDVRFVRVRVPSLLENLLDRSRNYIPIPVYLEREGKTGIGRRICTVNYKIVPIDRWIRDEFRGERVEVGIGFSLDERERCKPYAGSPITKIGRRALGYQRVEVYPLIDEHRIYRVDCHKVIAEVGLPPVPKSACFYCPFRSRTYWIELKRDQPHLFEQALEIEAACNHKRSRTNKPPITLHPDGALTNVVADQPAFDFEDGACVGHCFT